MAPDSAAPDAAGLTPCTGFARVERDHVRAGSYPGFDWVAFAEPSPRCAPGVPLARARVALVSTAGAQLPGQPRFHLGVEGDHSYRELPAAPGEIRLSHGGYDRRRAALDPDVVFPLGLLRRLAGEGVIGEVAPRAFSFMGYIPDPTPLRNDTGPEVARKLLADAVDLALLVPA